MLGNTILDLVGETPLVALRKVTPAHGALLLKLESMNPGGSAKDRAVKAMILRAEGEGRLRPGATVVEGTAGNTGVGLAMAAAARGYRAVVVMPANASPDKQAVLRALGAEVVLTPPDLPIDHPESYVAVARRLEQERPGAVRLAQFDNPANPGAHAEGTGPELWRDTGGRITVLIACVGTGGTLAGTARFLRAQNPALRVVAAHPEREPSAIEGVTDDDPPAEFGSSPIDARVKVSDAEAIATARRLARQEGLLVGLSSGAAVAAAVVDSRGWPESAVAVAIAPDTGRNYLGILGLP